MERVTISQLRKNLSAYLKKVRAGETVLILHRTHPVARLEPLRPDELADERLAELERQGLIRRPSRPMTAEEFQKFIDEPLPDAGVSLLEALLEERREER